MRAVKRLRQYCNDAFFVALVPDDASKVKEFYKDAFKKYGLPRFQKWSVRNWGYVTWGQVENFCKDNSLEGTQKVFGFNRGQIYGR